MPYGFYNESIGFLEQHATPVWRCDSCHALAAADEGDGQSYDDESSAIWLKRHLERSPGCKSKEPQEKPEKA